jgi:hypothetical protein
MGAALAPPLPFEGREAIFGRAGANLGDLRIGAGFAGSP